VVIFRSASQRLAMHVDEVLGNQEVVVKNLGPQLSRLPGWQGCRCWLRVRWSDLQPGGLATVYGDQVRAASAGHVHAGGNRQPRCRPKAPTSSMLSGPSQVPLILVVDDSITVRRVTQRLLQREGYRVSLAADGLQALERCRKSGPLWCSPTSKCRAWTALIWPATSALTCAARSAHHHDHLAHR
jgi:chemosensory pili system protein ChpA (sensor histidine kinase/response regulator)